MKTAESFAVFAIAATVILSLGYFLLLRYLGSLKDKPGAHMREVLYLARKIGGFLLFGLVPAAIAWIVFDRTPLQMGLARGDWERAWPWLTGATLFLILLNVFNSRNGEIRDVYPELRQEAWGLRNTAIAAGGWLIYLTGYEFLFRGILLLACYGAFGLWPAVAINLALYSALHLPKGMKESVAAIPFGALLCWIVLETRSILPAVLIHFLQAFSFEVCCIFRNPEMKFNLFERETP